MLLLRRRNKLSSFPILPSSLYRMDSHGANWSHPLLWYDANNLQCHSAHNSNSIHIITGATGCSTTLGEPFFKADGKSVAQKIQPCY